jgi:hypothetical protein
MLRDGFKACGNDEYRFKEKVRMVGMVWPGKKAGGMGPSLSEQ